MLSSSKALKKNIHAGDYVFGSLVYQPWQFDVVSYSSFIAFFFSPPPTVSECADAELVKVSEFNSAPYYWLHYPPVISLIQYKPVT